MLKLTSQHRLFPIKLNRLHKPPNEIFIISEGWKEMLELPTLAIVGSRRPSPYAKNACSQIAQEAARRGVVIVSGLALGIDSFAHKAAVEVGGKTIAVLPSGINHIYPASHRNLAKQIVEKRGALVSTYQPDEKIAFKGNFIARNRIIAGLSDAVLIPEAAEGSGSLHTAQFALELGIDVMAVPGQINNPNARGSNNLIKTGATMVTSISDVLNILKINLDTRRKYKDATATNELEQSIIDAISGGINDGEKIMIKTGMSIELFNQNITMLEINGHVKPGGANSWFLN